MTSVLDVRQIKTTSVETWRDANAVNDLLRDGWVILTCAPGQSQETGDSYVQMILGHDGTRAHRSAA
jgi:hypothetical protein